MANKLYEESAIQNIANAIRSVSGSSDTYKVVDMATAIEGISTGLDWSELNYESTPLEVTNGFNYAKDIIDSYTPSSTYANDIKLLFFPNIDISGRFNYQGMFQNSALLHIDPIILGEITPTGTITTNYMFEGTFIEDIEISTVNNANAGLAHTFKSCKRLKSAKINFKPIDIEGLFENCESLTTINTFDTSSITNMRYVFKNCKKLINAPSFDSSSNTLFNEFFNGCSELVNVPIYDTALVTNFSSMFSNCSSLSDTSLDNILVMCINATAYNGNKKLTQLGISNTYDSRIVNLTHYQAFIEAGWVIR